MIDANRRRARDAVFPDVFHLRDIVDRLIDEPRFGLNRIEAIVEAIEFDLRAGLRNHCRSAGQYGRIAAESARPIPCRAGCDDHKTNVRNENAASGPVVTIRERPLLAAQLAFADKPAAGTEKLLNAIANLALVAFDRDRCVERDAFDRYSAERRKSCGYHPLERAHRKRRENEPDDPDVRQTVVDVVEIETQDQARKRRRVIRPVEVGYFALLDDDADQREEAPNREQRHGEI